MVIFCEGTNEACFGCGADRDLQAEVRMGKQNRATWSLHMSEDSPDVSLIIRRLSLFIGRDYNAKWVVRQLGGKLESKSDGYVCLCYSCCVNVALRVGREFNA